MNHRVALPVAIAGSLATALTAIPVAVPGPATMTPIADEFAKVSPAWRVTSGSLFGHGPYLWSGVPDAGPAPHNDSAVLRAVSTGAGYRDAAVRFDLRVNALSSTDRTPARDFDGVHVMLRYRSEQDAWFVSVRRRDGRYAIKRKTPGGPSNGGTYRTLAATDPMPVRPGWHHVEAAIRGDRTVTVSLRIDGFPVLTAVDHVPAGTPAAGRVGLRGDNCDFLVRHFLVGPPLTRL